MPERQRCAKGEPADCVLRRGRVTCTCGEEGGKTPLSETSLPAVDHAEIQKRAAALPAIRDRNSYVVYLGDLASKVRGMPEDSRERIDRISGECRGLINETTQYYGKPEKAAESCRP